MKFTKQQIENWKSYENVRESGLINMFDALNGSKLAGISKEEYIFCLSNYSELKKVAYDEQ